MCNFLTLVAKTLASLVRPWAGAARRAADAWTDDEPQRGGRRVWHAVITREGEHVWGRGWFGTRQEARAALAEMVTECRTRAWGKRHPRLKAARVIRSWSSDSEGEVRGGEWHLRVTDLNTERRVIGRLPR